jgi:hypothetical protein
MKQNFLGDSYDIVKRFWAESLRPVAPLYAHPTFVPKTMRREYSAMTTIPILDINEGKPNSPFGILLDPDTGIPLPSESTLRHATASHAPLDFIIRVVRECTPYYLVCFDQSHHRVQGFSREAQRKKKITYLSENCLFASYYVSHAPFLFVASSSDRLSAILQRMSSIGLPPSRFEVVPLKSITTCIGTN